MVLDVVDVVDEVDVVDVVDVVDRSVTVASHSESIACL